MDKASPAKKCLERHQISFNSISSSESGLDLTNSSHRDADTNPLRIKRMPLFSPDYIQQRKASVENLLSRTPEHTSTLRRNPQDENGMQYRTRTMPSSASYDFEKLQHNPESYLTNSSIAPSSTGHRSSNEEYPTSSNPRYEESPTVENLQSMAENHNMTEYPMYPWNINSPSSNGRADRPLSTEIDSKPVRLEKPFKPTMEQTRENNSRSGSSASGESPRHSVKRETRQSIYHDVVTDNVPSRQAKPIKSEKTPMVIKAEQIPMHDVPIGKEPSSQSTQEISTPPKKSPRQGRQSCNERSKNCRKFCCSTLCSLFSNIFTMFSIWDIMVTLGSIALFIFDVYTDLRLSLTYYQKIPEHEDYRLFFQLTLGFVLGPSIIVMLFSLYFVFDDFHKKKKKKKELKPNDQGNKVTKKECCRLIFIIILHVLQLAPIVRYIQAMWYGLKSRYFKVKGKKEWSKHYDLLWKYELHDINLLRLLESFLESAPQLVLQLYIMIMTKNIETIAVISCVGSLVGVSSMIVSFQRAIRNANSKEKDQLSIFASIIMFCWRAFCIMSRVLAFALFLTIQPFVFLIFVLLHWAASFAVIACRGTQFCGTKKYLEYVFDGVCGLIYIFCFLNLSDNNKGWLKTRCLLIIFYMAVFIENVILSILWFFFRPGGGTNQLLKWKHRISGNMLQPSATQMTLTSNLRPTKEIGAVPDGYAVALVAAVIGCFIMGLIFMIVYYLMLHPRHKTFQCCSFTKSNKDNEPVKVSEPYHGNLGDPRSPNNGGYRANRGEAHLRSVHHASRSTLEEAKQHFGGDECSELIESEVHSQSSMSSRQRVRLRKIETTESSKKGNTWQMMTFDRGRRAEQVYTRQYSREKYLEDDPENATPNEGNLPDDSRQTDRFRAIVTPTCEKKALLKPQGKSLTHVRTKSPVNHPSIVIKPGTQKHSFQGGDATRSITHQGPLSTYTSPQRIGTPLSFNTSPGRHVRPRNGLPQLPPSVQNRDYSASMSCLMGRPGLSYVARREMALRHNVPHTPSFTIAKNEILESMESSL